MNEIERTKRIILNKKLEHEAAKTTYEALDLREPTLIEVESFYNKSKEASGLAAMKLLISLVSGGIPESVISRMAFTDYKQCEEFLDSFLSYTTKQTG